MLRWSSKALESIATLFRPLQDLDVYVEDEGSEVFYLELLSRLTDGEFRIVRILPLGGRSKVLEKCAQVQGQSRPALFIIDGDLEWVRGDNFPPLNGLYRHDAYCIENYLFCAIAATELIAESHGKISRKQAENLLSWNSFINHSIEPLIELFSVFATAQALAPSIPTVSRGIGSIVTSSKKGAPPKLDKAKLEQLRSDVTTQAINIAGKDAFDQKLEETRRRIAGLPIGHGAVSGKDFLLPLLRFHISSLAKAHYPDESFRFRLAKHCSIERLMPLKMALRRAAQMR